MSDLYDKIRHDVRFRKEVAEKAGLGFELPSKKRVVGPNGPKIESAVVLEIVASCKCLIQEINGAPGETRTPDPLVRSQMLYPTELRAHAYIIYYQ
jgi:hypothetical protein